VSNRDCVGVQWINPCINGSGGAVGVDSGEASFARDRLLSQCNSEVNLLTYD
jgi:hypothetical protein